MTLRMLFRLWVAALIGLAFAQPGVAQEPDLLAEAMALPVANNLAGARDVPRFAWVENSSGVRNIWVATRGQAERRLTSFIEDDGQQLYGLVFSHDGASLAFVRGGDEEFPDEEDWPNTGTAPLTPAQQVFVIPAEGGAPVELGEGHSPAFSPDGRRLAFTRRGEVWLWMRGSDARRIAKVDGNVDRLTWSPDGTRLLFSEDRGEHSYAAVLDADGQRLRYLDPGLGQSVEPIFSPGGGQVAFIRYLPPPAEAAPDTGPYWSIRVVDLATGAARTLWSAPPGPGGRYAGTRSRNLFWSQGGLILFPWEQTGWLHVYALDVQRGGEPRALTRGAFEVETFLIDRERDVLLYAANADHIDRRRIWRRPLQDGAPARLGGGGEDMHFFPTVAGGEVAAIATGVSTPAHPVLLGDRVTPLAAVPTASGFITPEEVVFRAADGVEVRGQLFRARGSGRRPALVYIHGGPRRQMLLGFHPSGYYSRAYAMNQHLAASGYHVLAVNYRGGTGYGFAFREAPDTGREGASEYRDILAAGRWLAAQDDVDRARIGLWGGSWGGYLTALALARDSDLFAAGVDLHGVHTLLRPVPNTLSPEAQERTRQLQWDSSPLGAIEGWRSPVLLIHGDDDQNVDFSQSLLLARELAARRIPYRELVFPNERHSFFRHESWLRSLRAAEDFFDLTLMRRQPLAASALPALPRIGAAPDGGGILIRGARVFDGTGAPAAPADVLIQGERIAAVGTGLAVPRGARVVNARAMTLIPGLHDLHAHLRSPGLPAPDDLGKAYAGQLVHGVTTVNDFSVSGEMLAPIRDMTASGAVTAPNLMLAIRLGVPGGHGTERGWGNAFTLEANTPRAAEIAVRRALAYRPNVIKVFADGWRYRRSEDLNSMNLPTLRAIVERAHEAGVPVIVHTVTVEGARIAAEAGVDALGHGIGDAIVDDELIALMRANGTAYVPTMVAYEPQQTRAFARAEWRRLRPPERAREEARMAKAREPIPGYAVRVWAALRENLRRLKEGGVRVGIGTDAGIGGVYQGSSAVREVRILTQHGFTPAEALAAATSVSAGILRQGDDHGRIAPGQRADLVLVRGRPDERIEDLYDVRRVFVAGREIALPRLRDLRDSDEFSPLPSHPMAGPIDTGAGTDGRTDLNTLPVETNEAGVDHSHLHHARMADGQGRLFLYARMGGAPEPYANLVLPLTPGAVHLADARSFAGIAFEARGTGRYSLLLETYGIEPQDSFRTSFSASETDREITIPFSAFQGPEGSMRIDPARLRALAFRLEGDPGGAATLELGNIRFFR